MRAIIFLLVLLCLIVPINAQNITSFERISIYAITNIGQATLTNYQVAIPINTTKLIIEGKLRGDCGDLRVYDANFNPLPYWIDRCGYNNSILWTKIPSLPIGKTLIYVASGNSSITSNANASAVFNYFFEDNFDSLNTSYWTHREGSTKTIVTDYYISPPSSLKLYHPTTSPYHADVGHLLTTDELPNAGEKLIIEVFAMHRMSDSYYNQMVGLQLWNATTHNVNTAHVVRLRLPSSSSYIVVGYQTGYTYTDVFTVSASTYLFWRHLRIEYIRATSTAIGCFDGGCVANTSLTYGNTLFVRIYGEQNAEGGSDNFRMYKVRYVDPAPIVTLQCEIEPQPLELQLPNIRVNNLSITAFSGSISVNSPVYVNFTISNPTIIGAGAFTIAIYEQTTKIGEYYISNLQPGDSINISHIWYPEYSGQRTIRVVADTYNEVSESSELDNIAEQTVQVSDAQFLIHNFNVYPRSGKEPLEITATATIENIGGIGGYYLVTLYINNVAKQQYVLFVPANQTRQVNFTWIFNASGTYSVSINNLYPLYIYVFPQTPLPVYNPWFNTTDILYNFTKSGWYMVAVYTFAPFQEIAFPLLYTFVFGISFIRTRNIATCVFMTLLFTALYVVFVPLWMMKIIYILSAVMIGGVLWMVFGRK